jgi:ribonuclease E
MKGKGVIVSKKMLINTIDEEESRMAIVEDGRLKEYDVKMSVREPTTGNIYKGIVKKVERGLRAAFVDYGGKKNGFLPLHDVSPEYIDEKSGKLSVGQEILVKVLREEKGNKGAMLTTYLSLPGRYMVLMPNRTGAGISRKI